MQNLNVDRIVFNSVQEVNSFYKDTKTNQANIIFDTLKKYVKTTGKNKDVYYYNKISKLWVCCDYEDYTNFFYKFFNNTITDIKKLPSDDLYKNVIDKVCKEFDKKSYIIEVSDIMAGDLKDLSIISKLNNNPDYLPLKNGKKIHFKTLEVVDRTEDDYFTYESPVNYLDKELKNANKFFSQIMPNENNREYLRKILGYTLTGRTDARNFFIWYGAGSNGKSLISNLLNKILGEQYTQCDQSIFIKSNKNAGSASPELMALIGKRCGVYSEGESADNIEMNLSQIKQISGEDVLTGRQLYSKMIKFNLYIKLHMLSNFTPPLNAEPAIKERLRYIFLDSRFVENPVNKNEFKKDSEYVNQLETIYLDEIFSWIIKGAQIFYNNPIIEVPQEFQERTNKILSSSDSIKTYIERHITITKNERNDRINKKELFEHYINFCINNSQRCQARTSLFTRLDQLDIPTGPYNGYDCYKGIKFKDEVEIEEEEEDEGEILLRQINELNEKIKNKEYGEEIKTELKKLRKTIKNITK